MSNNYQYPVARALIFEILDNGKVLVPCGMPYPTPEQTITVDELKEVKNLIELMIANPTYFHIVRDANTPATPIICSRCHINNVPENSKICHDCERKGILEAVNNNVPPTPFFQPGGEKSVYKKITDLPIMECDKAERPVEVLNVKPCLTCNNDIFKDKTPTAFERGTCKTCNNPKVS